MSFVFKMQDVTYQTGLFYIGMGISAVAFTALFIVPLFDKNPESVLEPVTEKVRVK